MAFHTKPLTISEYPKDSSIAPLTDRHTESSIENGTESSMIVRKESHREVSLVRIFKSCNDTESLNDCLFLILRFIL